LIGLPRKIYIYGVFSSAVGHERTCALRAPTVFLGYGKKLPYPKNTVMDKSKGGLGCVLYTIVDCARMAFHPCPIDDPRGRIFVRATSQLCTSGGRELIAKHKKGRNPGLF
jgi:hypothetical protein